MTDTLPTHYQPITYYPPTQSPTITDPLPNHYQPITDTLPTHYQPITHITRETHTACRLQLALRHFPLLPQPPRNLRGWAAVPLSANRSTAKQKQKATTIANRNRKNKSKRKLFVAMFHGHLQSEWRFAQLLRIYLLLSPIHGHEPPAATADGCHYLA